MPSANPVVDQGPVPSRSDMSYRWAHDETQVTFKVLIDGQWRTLSVGAQRGDLFYDRSGEVVARVVQQQGQQQTLVASVDVLDRAAAALRRGDGETDASPTADAYRPKLCPDPIREPKTTKSKNSIRYQEYVSHLPYGLAINVGGVNFDGCDPATGTLLEAKAKIDFIFNSNGDLHTWVYRTKSPETQMKRQAQVALAAGRSVVWHAQTLKGYRGLSLIADDLKLGNLSVVYDPN